MPLPYHATPPGPLSGTSDEEKIHRLEKNKKAFGSHDIHSLQVISNLKKVTIALEGGRQDNKDEEEEKKVREREGRTLQNGVESSLDFTSLDAQPSPARSPRQQRFVSYNASKGNPIWS